MLIRLLLLFLLSTAVHAKESENFCLDKQYAKTNEELARKHPNDKIIVKLVALRYGLCDLIEKKIIDLDFAIELFNSEHQKGIYKRIEEEQTSKRETGT